MNDLTRFIAIFLTGLTLACGGKTEESTCDSGFERGDDGNCYLIEECDEGQILGADGECYDVSDADADTDADTGHVQRIFYFHVPVAILALASIVLVAAASAAHLITRAERWDSLAYSAAELGVVFATLIIVTGSIWAKPVWGVWWTWDAKLTTTLILWFIYVSYLMLRAYGPKGSQGARLDRQGAARGPKLGPISSSPLRVQLRSRSSMVPPQTPPLGCPWV